MRFHHFVFLGMCAVANFGLAAEYSKDDFLIGSVQLKSGKMLFENQGGDSKCNIQTNELNSKYYSPRQDEISQQLAKAAHGKYPTQRLSPLFNFATYKIKPPASLLSAANRSWALITSSGTKITSLKPYLSFVEDIDRCWQLGTSGWIDFELISYTDQKPAIAFKKLDTDFKLLLPRQHQLVIWNPDHQIDSHTVSVLTQVISVPSARIVLSKTFKKLSDLKLRTLNQFSAEIEGVNHRFIWVSFHDGDTENTSNLLLIDMTEKRICQSEISGSDGLQYRALEAVLTSKAEPTDLWILHNGFYEGYTQQIVQPQIKNGKCSLKTITETAYRGH